MEKKDNKKSEFVGLHTMIPKEVHDELSAIAYSKQTFTGNWNYGEAIREALWARRVFFNVNTRLDEVEQDVREVLANQADEQKPKLSEDEKDANPLGLMGRHHMKKEEQKDGKD